MSKLLFNPVQKQEYMDYETIPAVSESIKRYFQRLSDKEFAYGKDLADMNNAELRDTLSSLNVRRHDSIGHLISLVKAYIDWAIKVGKTDNDSAIHGITPESIQSKDSIARQMISSPEHLRDILVVGINQLRFGYREAVGKLIMYLLYEGVSLEEIRQLKKDSKNQTGQVVSNGKTYQLNDEVSELWDVCKDTHYFERSPGKSSKIEVKLKLCENDYLIRTVEGKNTDTSAPIRDNYIREIVAYVFDAYSKASGVEMKVPPRNIIWSGLFYRMYSEEKNGRKMTPERIAYYFDIKYDGDTDLLMRTRKWSIDYHNWKIAFDYS